MPNDNQGHYIPLCWGCHPAIEQGNTAIRLIVMDVTLVGDKYVDGVSKKFVAYHPQCFDHTTTGQAIIAFNKKGGN
jgi:hypothetical protein